MAAVRWQLYSSNPVGDPSAARRPVSETYTSYAAPAGTRTEKVGAPLSVALLAGATRPASSDGTTPTAGARPASARLARAASSTTTPLDGATPMRPGSA